MQFRRIAAACLAGILAAVPAGALAGNTACFSVTDPAAYRIEECNGNSFLLGAGLADGLQAEDALKAVSSDMGEVRLGDHQQGAPLATGQTLYLVTGSGTPDGRLTVVVRGDVAGTGMWSVTQLAQAAAGIRSGFDSDARMLAADMNGDGEATLTDLVLLARTKPQAEPDNPLAARTVELVNQLRAEAGRNALTENADLNRAAQLRAEEMAASGILSHERPDGTRWFTVFTTDARSMGENIVMLRLPGEDIAGAAVDAWTDSLPHYKNMTGDEFTQMGSGYAKGAAGRWYGCQLFAGAGTFSVV